MKQLAGAVCCTFAFLGFFCILNAQQDFETSQASTGGNNAVHPSVGVSDNGHIMTVWWDEDRNRIIARIFIPGSGWGSVMEIPGQGAPSTWPRVKGGAGSEFHVVWSAGYSEHFHDILYAHYRNGSFSSAITLQSGNSMWPDLCYNLSRDTLSVAWEEYVGGVNGEIMVRQRVRGSWGGEVNASRTELWSGRVRIANDDAGNLYAAWQEKTQLDPPGEILEAFYNRTVNGAWQNSVNMSNGGAYRLVPNLAVNPSGTEVMVQWYNYTDKFHWGRAIGYSGSSPSYGAAHRIAHGSYDHLHYYTGMAYHLNVLYITLVDDGGQVWIKNYNGNNIWGNGLSMSSVNCPRTPDLAQSPNLGLAVSWYNLCETPDKVYMAFGEGFGDSPGPTPPPPPKPNVPPTARILLWPSSGIYPLRVDFDGTASTDSDGRIVTYAWTLGDGNTDTNAKFSHTYQSKGSYAIYLTVTDDRGGTSTASAVVTVFGVEPPLNISYTHNQNRNLFSTEHYFRLTWQNNPINEQRGFNVVRYNIYRRIKGQGSWQFLVRVPRKDSNEYLDRSLKNDFQNYEFTVTCQDIEGRQSDLTQSSNQTNQTNTTAPDKRPKEKK